MRCATFGIATVRNDKMRSMKDSAAKAIKDFMDYLIAQDASPLTISGYRYEVTEFFKHNDLAPAEVKKSHGLAYLAHLKQQNCGLGGKPLMSRTIKRKFSALSAFFNYLVYQAETQDRNPIKGIKMPKGPGKPKVVMTEAEATAMLDLPADSWQHKMDKLCLELFYSTGARRADLSTAKLSDLNLAESYLSVIGKGKKPANLTLTPRCMTFLKEYLQSGRPDSKDAHLLLNEDGTPYTANQIYNGVLRSAKRAGIKKLVHPHAWRRSIGTHLMNRGMPIKSISNFLRHNNMATTDGYLMADEQKVKEDHKTFHPLQ